jgi:8-oxo-dGTP pyrophosphatase MutT (NUDIX family)
MSSVPFEETYVGSLRRHVGTQRLITPGPRAIILDDAGDVLLVCRSDDGTWVMPAGGLELGESIWDALAREVHEETGLVVEAATPIALYTGPQYWFTNAYGGEHQMFAVAFRVDRWSGSLVAETDETRDARFFGRDELPPLRPVYQETLADLEAFDGTMILK